MKDAQFIAEMLRRGNEAGEKVKAEFTALTISQLNWKPAEDSWSIGQCLDHLVVSDCLYFPAFEKVVAGKYEMNFWENWNPLSGLFGSMLASQVQEQPRKNLNAPKIFLPSASTIDAGILDRFHKHLDSLLNYIADFIRTDIDKIHITSPVSRVVTYSLRKAILILVQHEHRHINQAIRVKSDKNFPA